jgi:hypothetical protein
MTYLSSKEKVLLFGGDSNQILGDAWEWDGKEWTQVADTGASARGNYTITHDKSSQNVVLFSGFSSRQQAPGDTCMESQ